MRVALAGLLAVLAAPALHEAAAPKAPKAPQNPPDEDGLVLSLFASTVCTNVLRGRGRQARHPDQWNQIWRTVAVCLEHDIGAVHHMVTDHATAFVHPRMRGRAGKADGKAPEEAPSCLPCYELLEPSPLESLSTYMVVVAGERPLELLVHDPRGPLEPFTAVEKMQLRPREVALLPVWLRAQVLCQSGASAAGGEEGSCPSGGPAACCCPVEIYHVRIPEVPPQVLAHGVHFVEPNGTLGARSVFGEPGKKVQGKPPSDRTTTLRTSFHRLFATNVYRMTLDRVAAKNNQLLDMVEKLRKATGVMENHPGKRDHNMNKAQRKVFSKTRRHHKTLQASKVFQHLKGELDNAVCTYMEAVHGKGNWTKMCDKVVRAGSNGNETGTYVWATVMDAGTAQRVHRHPDALVSGVYYANAPRGSSPVQLLDPRGPISPLFEADVVLQPQPGQLLLWPAWLSHEIMPSLTDPYSVDNLEGLRVSFGFSTALGGRETVEAWKMTASGSFGELPELWRGKEDEDEDYEEDDEEEEEGGPGQPGGPSEDEYEDEDEDEEEAKAEIKDAGEEDEEED